MNYDDEGLEGGDDFGPQDKALQLAIRDRVSMPAYLLMAVGILDFVLALAFIYYGNAMSQMPPEDIAKAKEQMTKEQKQQWVELEKQGYTMEGMVKVASQTLFINGGIAIVISLISVFAGARMLQMQSYGLAFLGAVVAAIPCISPSACCGLGEVAGLWAIVVLLNADVKSAFR